MAVARLTATRWLALIAASTSCTAEDEVFLRPPLAIPAEVAWVAALLEDPDTGELIATTPLVAWNNGGPLRFNGLERDTAKLIELVGFSEAQLAMMSAPGVERLTVDRVTEANGCEPELDAPIYRARMYANGDVASASDSPRRLTAKWLDGICPRLEGRISVDVQCRLFRCPIFTQQEGCALAIDLENCNEGTFGARVDWRGGVCGETSNKPECRFTEQAKDPALMTIACDPTCDRDVHLTDLDPGFVLDSIRVVRGVTMRAAGSVSTLGVRIKTKLSGYTSDLIALDGRVIVATHDGRFQEEDACDFPEPARLVFLDPDSLFEIKTATAPPCLNRLLAEPGARQFYGFYGPRIEPKLGVFDDEGRRISEHALALPEAGARYYDRADAFLTRDTNELAILFKWSTIADPERFGNTIAAIDRASFATRILWDKVGGGAYSIGETDESVLAIADDEADAVITIETRTGAQVGVNEQIIHFGSLSIGELAWHAATREFVLAVPYEEPNIHIITSAYSRGHATFFEEDAGPTIAIDWPADPQLMIAAAAYAGLEPVRDVYLTLFDPRVPRYLPGAIRAGFGVTGEAIREGDRVWITLPWEGSVLRISPHAN